ncbi:hypothetical protein [Chitinolyticbacter albus]|uniref:hypothetical protein n=1 Tax=Chitinolyticbacter albus TaxID=2961951 RepID=UPI00210D75B0|nr:hypothetical protein [Chitinolyticbacter albus]
MAWAGAVLSNTLKFELAMGALLAPIAAHLTTLVLLTTGAIAAMGWREGTGFGGAMLIVLGGGLIVNYALLFCLGLPLAIALRRAGRYMVPLLCLCGFAAGCVPFALVFPHERDVGIAALGYGFAGGVIGLMTAAYMCGFALSMCRSRIAHARQHSVAGGNG